MTEANKLDKVFDVNLIKTVNNELIIKKFTDRYTRRNRLSKVKSCSLTVWHSHMINMMQMIFKKKKKGKGSKQSCICRRIESGFAFAHCAIETL